MRRFFIDYVNQSVSGTKTRKTLALQLVAEVFRFRILDEKALMEAIETLRRAVDAANASYSGRTAYMSVSPSIALTPHGWIRIYFKGGANDCYYIVNVSVTRIDGDLLGCNIAPSVERTLAAFDNKVADAFAELEKKGGAE